MYERISSMEEVEQFLEKKNQLLKTGDYEINSAVWSGGKASSKFVKSTKNGF